MHTEVMSHNTIISLPLLALFIFLLVFLAVVIRVWRAGRHDPEMDYIASLPLADDEGLKPTAPPSPDTAAPTTPQGDSHGQG